MPAHPEEPVVLRCGVWGVAPLFLVQNGSGLCLHWDVAQLYAYLREAPDFERMAFMLRHMTTPYSRRTLFPELLQLTERSEATWQPGRRPVVDYPPPVPHSLARRLVPEADVLGTFESLMSAVVGRWSPKGEIGPCELSGGLDSSTVVVVASKCSRRPIRTYGLIMPGWEGDAQVLRRTEVIQACGGSDVPVRGITLPPFHAGERGQEDAMLLSGEYCHESFRAMLSRVRDDGGATILRGIGGDEIAHIQYGEFEEEGPVSEVDGRADTPSFMTNAALEASAAVRPRLDSAPQGSADQSVYEAMAACSIVYLRSCITGLGLSVGRWLKRCSPYHDWRQWDWYRSTPFVQAIIIMSQPKMSARRSTY
jgi:asparagine synthase (glutamine-hydrolysing)